MPLVSPIRIPFEGDSSQLIHEISLTEKRLDDYKAKIKATGKELERQARAEAAAAEKAKMSWTDFRSMYQTVLDVVRVGQQVWKETVGLSQEYADTIRELTLVSGASAQETSRFVQVLDDYNISASEVMVATKALTKEGYAPTIETLALLSDEYLKLGTTQEKNEFILKNLGKGGLQWVEVLNKGSAAIRKQGDEVSKSLIVNQKQLDASKALFLEMDRLEDSSKGLGTAIGNYLTPALEALIHITTGSTDSLADWFAQLAENRTISIEMSRLLKEQGLITEKGNTATKEQIEAIRIQATINVRATQATEANTSAEDDNADAKDRQKKAVEAATNALNDYKDMLDEVSKANQDAESFIQSYADSQKDYEKSHAEAAARLQQAISEGDKEAIAEAQKGIQELEASWHESTQKMIYDMALAKVSVDGLTDAEFRATQELAVQMGIRTQAQADEAISMMEKANAIADGIALQEDVMKEKADQDAELLRLENEKAAAADDTTAAIVDGSAASASAVDTVTGSVDSATLSLMRMAEQAQRTASAVGSIPPVGGTPAKAFSKGGKQQPMAVPAGSRDSGGRGYAGNAYMIGVGAQPEMFIPDTNGTFIPNADKKAAAGGNVYNVVINNPKREATEESMRKFLMKMNYTGAAV